MKFSLNDEELVEITKIKDNVEDHSKVIDKIVNDIINPYCRDLDNYVTFIKDCLKDGENPPTNDELDDFCLNLSTYILTFAIFFIIAVGTSVSCNLPASALAVWSFSDLNINANCPSDCSNIIYHYLPLLSILIH